MADNDTNVALAPAPWQLTGQAYIVALKCDENFLSNKSFLPESLQATRSGDLAYMMFVDYSSSDVGPYHELLFIPGSCQFADGKKHLTISRIFVSSTESVVNGQNNWGIPKDRADFNVTYGEDGVTAVEIHFQNDFMAALEFTSLPLSLPVIGKLIPAKFRTLAQHFDAKTYIYTPEASGQAQLGKMKSCRINPTLFPDVSQQKVLACAHLKRFKMCFPVADVYETL